MIAGLELSSARGQVIVILLSALFDLRGGRRKQEVLNRIKERKWFEIKPEDRVPYPNGSSKEPRWETLIAWGRKDALEAGLLEESFRDNWEISKNGHNEFVRVRNAYREGKYSVRDCFLWTPVFKREIDPTWEDVGTAVERPPYMYNDLLPPWMNSTKGSELSRGVDEFVRKMLAEYGPKKDVEATEED